MIHMGRSTQYTFGFGPTHVFIEGKAKASKGLHEDKLFHSSTLQGTMYIDGLAMPKIKLPSRSFKAGWRALENRPPKKACLEKRKDSERARYLLLGLMERSRTVVLSRSRQSLRNRKDFLNTKLVRRVPSTGNNKSVSE